MLEAKATNQEHRRKYSPKTKVFKNIFRRSPKKIKNIKENLKKGLQKIFSGAPQKKRPQKKFSWQSTNFEPFKN